MIDKLYQSNLAYKIFCSMPRVVKKPAVNILYLNRLKNLKNLNTPKVLTFFVTNRCNARCKHCFYWKELNQLKNNEMSLEQIAKFAKSLKHPLQSVLLTGGEPFLRKDLADICRIFSEFNKTLKVTIPTNGYFSEHIFSTVQRILDETNLYVDLVISFDGFEKTAAKIRGLKDIFVRGEHTINLLKKIKNKRFKFSVLTTASSQNFNEIISLIKYNQKNWKVPHRVQYVRSCNEVFGLNPSILNGFIQKDTNHNLPSFEEMAELNKQIRDISDDKSLLMNINHLERETAIEILKSKKQVMKCVAGAYDGVIFPNGDVSMCEFTKPFANLKETDYDFYKLWNSGKAESMRQKIKACSCIHSCNLIDSMSHDKIKITALANGG